MKRFFLAALAIAAIASCAKNEVVSVPDQSEITFQTVATKAAQPFDEDNKFVSYAWFLPKDEAWATDAASSSAYISGAEIGYNSTANAWKATDTYYWPKQGSLTFFAWTVNTVATPSLTEATVGCTNTEGITVTAYDLTKNKNVDFMVADMQADQTENTTTVGTWSEGVPTVFKHALSKLEFKVVTVDNSGNAKDYDSENVSFTLKSIALTGVNNNKTYAQGINAIANHTWTEASPVAEITSLPVYTNTAPGLTVTSAVQTLVPSANDYYIVLPQNMDADDMLEIEYDITTSYTGSPVTENVSQSVKLSEIYTSGWEPTTNYVLTIKLGIKEIYWAPSVEPWTDGASASTQF